MARDSTIVNKIKHATTDIFLKHGNRERDATLNAVMVYACNNNKLEQITNILKNGELKMKDSLKMLPMGLNKLGKEFKTSLPHGLRVNYPRSNCSNI